MEVRIILKKVLIIHTGGTFGMLEEDGRRRPRNESSAASLLSSVPELAQLADVEIESPFTIDSAELSLDNINILAQLIAHRCSDVDGYVVIHGTDTMAYTASALSFMLQGLHKPIIFTGSQRPAIQIRTDAKSNLINSVEVATSNFKEVAIFFGNRLLRGNRSTKVSTWKFEAFESPNFPILGEAGMNISFNLFNVKAQGRQNTEFSPFCQLKPSLFVLPIFPGLRPQYLDDLLSSDIQAFIISAYGVGNMPTDQEHGLLTFIERIIASNRIVAIQTQSHHGSVSLNMYESGHKAKLLGALSCQDMTLEASVMKLCYLLSRYPKDIKKISRLFETNLCGELSEDREAY
ncbi:MAG: asparaginase [Sphaerochaetaceae bacterium]